MLYYFPAPYEDELLYSVFARYHSHMGHIYSSDTNKDLFDNKNIYPSPDLGKYLYGIENKIKFFGGISGENLLLNNTMYHYYTNFTNLKIKNEVRQITLGYRNLGEAYRILGQLASSIGETNFLKFCPKCVEDDINQYGEPYWHLSHQLISSFYCLKHPEQYLYNSQSKFRIGRNTSYNCASMSNCIVYEEDNHRGISEKYRKILIKITKIGVELSTKNYNWGEIEFYKIYRVMLAESGYLMGSNMINQSKFQIDFLNYYGEELLSHLKCSLHVLDRSCWLRLITIKNRSIFHPIKHILLLLFLNKGLDDVDKFKFKENEKTEVFDRGFYPCLNPAATHYKEMCITEVEVSKNTQGLMRGVFKCTKCDFTYSRFGPDKDEADIFSYKNVLERGDTWMSRLEYLYYEEGLTYTEIGKILNVTGNTVSKYLKGFERKGVDIVVRRQKIEQLKKDWLNLIKKYPNYSKTKLSELNKALYTALYKNDKEWLKKNPPINIGDVKKTNTIFWRNRDNEYLELFKQVVTRIETYTPPIRINMNRLEIESNIRDLKAKLKKLPLTEKYILSKLENKNQFQIRKGKWIIESLIETEPYVTYKMVKAEGSFKNISIEVENTIIEMLESVRGGIVK